MTTLSRSNLVATSIVKSESGTVASILADGTTHQPRQAAFDLVTILHLQLPAALLASALARRAGALSPGGTLLVIGDDTTNLSAGYGGPRTPPRTVLTLV